MTKAYTRTIWLLSEKVMRLVNSIVISIAIAKQLGPTDFGKLNVALAFAGFFVAIVGMGADNINQSELRRRQADSNRFYLAAIIVRIVVSIIASSVFYIFGKVALDFEYLPLIGMIVASAFMVSGARLLAEGGYEIYAKIQIVGIVISGIYKYLGLYNNCGLEYFIGAAIIDGVFVAFVFTIIAIYEIVKNKQDPKWPKEVVREYVKLCLPTLLSSALVYVYFKLEVILLNQLVDNDAVGLWAVSQMFVQPWTLFALAVLPIVSNQIISSYEDSKIYEKKIIKVVRYGVAMGLMAAVVSSIASVLMVELFLGEQYRSVPLIVMMNSPAIIFLFIGSIQDLFIAHRKKTSIVLKKVIIGLPLNILILGVSIFTFGVGGAAVGMVISLVITSVYLNKFFDEEFFSVIKRSLGR